MITPFRIEIPQADLDDLRDRLRRTRWTGEIAGTGWARGVPLAYLRDLADYWAEKYDWRAMEAKLNEYPQFTTEIDGQNIHFLHIRSAREDAFPLILTHGWPGSVIEFSKVVKPLTEAGFHLVIPSLPGFGFSGPTTEPGWNTDRVAVVWAELMDRLGYERYGAQGGDLGSFVATELGRAAPGKVAGIHVNAATYGYIPHGEVSEEELATLSDVEKERVGRLKNYLDDMSGYFQIQATRPQTLAYGLNDSPVGTLAWIVEKFKEWTDPADGMPEDALSRDEILTNVMIYWLTGTIGSSAHMYYENMHSGNWHADRATTPTGVAAFAQDVAIRRYAEYGNTITHWSDFSRGGHFAALEAPDLFAADVIAFFETVR